MDIFGYLKEVRELWFRKSDATTVTVKPNSVADPKNLTFQLPDMSGGSSASDTLVGVSVTQTLTNKTLTSPTLDSATIKTATGGSPSTISKDTILKADTGGTDQPVSDVVAATARIESASSLVPVSPAAKDLLVTRDSNGDVGTGTAPGTLGINNLYVNNLTTAGTITGTVAGTAALAKDLDGSLPNGLLVTKGGTGNTSLTSNGVLFGQGTGSIGATSSGTQYQVLQAGAGGTPAFGALDLSQSAATQNTLPVSRGGTNLSGTPTNGQLLIGNGTDYSLATLTAGTGISVTNSAGGISLSATGFTGSLAGDVTGTQSATSVDKIKGKAVSGTAPTDAQDLVWNDSTQQWVPVSFSGDVTRTNSGAVTVATVGGKSASSISTSVNDTTAASSTNVVSTLVKRNSSGGFEASNVAVDGFNRISYTPNGQIIGVSYDLQYSKPFIRIVGGTTLNSIVGPSSGSVLVLVNEASDVTINHDMGSPASAGIFTGTGTPYALKGNSAISLIYDDGISRWVISGGAGAGAGGTTDTVVQTVSFSVGDVLYNNGGTTQYAKANAGAANTAEVVGIISKVLVAGGQYELTLSGAISGLVAANFTEAALPAAGTAVFLSTIDGKMTVSEPSTLGQVSVPLGVYLGGGRLYFIPKRGNVVGGTNARTQLSLASNASTQIFNAASPTLYTAGELTGWVQLGTSQRFLFKAPFAQNGAGTDWNISPSYVGDTPPSGFSISISAAGAITATCPTFSGTGLINYALNAPAVGATFPLAVDASSITTGTVAAARLPAATGSTIGAILFDEGSYTPTLSATGWSFSGAGANYCRVGNKVTVWGYADATGVRTGTLTITLPITPATFAASTIARQQAAGMIASDTGVSGLIGTAGGVTIEANGGAALITSTTGLRWHFSYRI